MTDEQKSKYREKVAKDLAECKEAMLKAIDNMGPGDDPHIIFMMHKGHDDPHPINCLLACPGWTIAQAQELIRGAAAEITGHPTEVSIFSTENIAAIKDFFGKKPPMGKGGNA